MKTTIRIEGGRYTSLKSAAKYVARGRAVVINRDDEDILVFVKDIQLRPHITRPTVDRIHGKFEWHGGVSGGFAVMKASHNDN